MGDRLLPAMQLRRSESQTTASLRLSYFTLPTMAEEVLEQAAEKVFSKMRASQTRLLASHSLRWCDFALLTSLRMAVRAPEVVGGTQH
jgi:hypothetical protein